jgi:hypothetical protein
VIDGYKDVRLVGDCDIFRLEYTPTHKYGKPRRVRLDAENEDDEPPPAGWP